MTIKELKAGDKFKFDDSHSQGKVYLLLLQTKEYSWWLTIKGTRYVSLGGADHRCIVYKKYEKRK